MHNTPIIIDGVRFHSTEEGNEWQRLRIRERCGDIRDLQRQVEYKIFINGIHVCSWFADFVYVDVTRNEQMVVDSKGFRTDMYKLKRKMVQAYYNITITEVTQGTRKNARKKRAA